jgi:polyhydroxyalkanoic acid synthase PhaR subunit
MSQQKNFNPFEIWRDFYNQTSNTIDENLNDESTSKVMGQVLEMNLLYKKLLNETTERYFDQVNIPTRNDLANISSLIINVEAKVDDLEELIEDTQANQGNQEEVKELKSEMTDVKNKVKNLDTKLNQILSLLQSNTKEESNKGTAAAQSKQQQSKQQPKQLSGQ